MSVLFELQGHRGARGLRPENTLPAFEAAFDLGVSAVETDLHLTRDGVVVLYHDAHLGDPPCTLPDATAGLPPPAWNPFISSLSLAELRCYRADRNPSPNSFPYQDASVTPLAREFAAERGFDPHGIPTLADLFQFAAAYAGEPGRRVGKTDAQRARSRDVRFDLELKRVPFRPEVINDGFTGRAPGPLEQRVLEAARAAGVVARTTVRSFDNRSAFLLRQMEPGLRMALLVADTAPLAPDELARAAGADLYCPNFLFLDEDLVRRAHAGGVRVVPWTVNEPLAWRRLLDWGVDGLTTDFPDRLAAFLRERGVAF
jgi:glycerophosphoryl diester phosphodiesterase